MYIPLHVYRQRALLRDALNGFQTWNRFDPSKACFSRFARRNQRSLSSRDSFSSCLDSAPLSCAHCPMNCEVSHSDLWMPPSFPFQQLFPVLSSLVLCPVNSGPLATLALSPVSLAQGGCPGSLGSTFLHHILETPCRQSLQCGLCSMVTSV